MFSARVLDELLEVSPLSQRAAHLCAVVVDDHRAARVHDRRKADVVAVNARFEDGAQALVFPKGDVGIDVARDDAPGAMEDRVGQHLSPRQALLEHHVGQTIREEGAECHHRQPHDGCHADDLLDADAQAHGSKVKV